jgi:hypothetical protein
MGQGLAPKLDPGPTSPARLWAHAGAWAGVLEALMTATGLVLCFRGRTPVPFCVLLAGGAPLLRWVIDSDYRGRVRKWLGELWDSLVLYPVFASRLPLRATLVTVVLPAALLLLTREYSITSGDSKPVILQAASLAMEGNWELSEYAAAYAPYYPSPGDRDLPYFCRRTPSGIYSSYPGGMVVFALPMALTARLVGADLTDLGVHGRLEKWTAAWVAAACLGLFFLLALHLARPEPAWMATLLLATGSAIFTTVGQALWQHGGVVFWSLLLLLVEFHSHGRPARGGVVLQGVAGAMLLACRLSAATFIVAFLGWILFRSPRRALATAVWAALAYAPWALLHASIYGNALGPSVVQLAPAFWSWSLSHLVAVLVCPGRGLIVYQPWLLLIPLAWLPSVHRQAAMACRGPCPPGWQTFCISTMALHLILISRWFCWWGGYCWGSRLATEVVPLGGLLCIQPISVLWSSLRGKRLLVALILVSSWMHLPAVYLRQAGWGLAIKVDSHPEMLWSWSNPPFLYPFLGKRHAETYLNHPHL